MSKMTNFRKIITQTMGELSKKDFDGALPYLMLTSKSESVMRDLLAFRLQRKLQPAEHQINGPYAVAREWKRADIVVPTPNGPRRYDSFKTPKVIIEIKMVAAPGKNGKAVIGQINSLADQLGNRKKQWRNAELFGLLAVRIFSEAHPNSTSAFDEVIIHRKKSLKPVMDLDRTVKNEAKQLGFLWAKPRTFVCGEDKFLRATVNLKWWLFSLR